MRASQHGFTLVELSIVLVIIGLLAGGVLVGRDLIYAAQIRKAVGQVEKFDLAVNAFQLKYACLPGDCAKASQFGLGTNGNGDGIILYSLAEWQEYPNFWGHIYAARLLLEPLTMIASYSLPDPTLNCPTLALPGAIAPDGGRGCFLFLTKHSRSAMEFYKAHWSPGPNVYWITGRAAPDEITMPLTPMDAFAIDGKLDDGMPLGGKVRAGGNYIEDLGVSPANAGAGGASAEFCVADDVTPNAYNILNTSRAADSLCSLLIRAGF